MKEKTVTIEREVTIDADVKGNIYVEHVKGTATIELTESELLELLDEIRTIKLKPCPFCGGTKLGKEAGVYRGTGYLYCERCHARSPLETTEENGIHIEEAWNQRVGKQ
jgi:Lar family restriction alleviation protein